MDPQSVTALMNRGAAYGNKGDYDNAIADFNAVLRINPAHAAAYAERGLSFSRKGDKAKAIADYETAIRLNPKLATAYNNRGTAYMARGDQARALTDYNEAIRLSPNSILFRTNRGILLSNRGETADALADFNKVLELHAVTPADKQRQDVARSRIARLKETPAPTTIRHKRVALVIGNANYPNAPTLANPVNDAKSFAAALRRLDFTLVTEDYNVSHERMARLLKDFGDQAEGSEWAVVYFAGHGLELNGNTYLIPTDAELKRDTHVDDEAVSLNRVMTKVDAAKSLGLVILDSCRNNPFVNRMSRSAGATRSVSAGLAPIEPDGNVLVAYSARHGTVAEDGSGEHSPFTEALLRHIEEPGLEINFLFRKVRDDVRKKTERRQEPFLYGSLGSEPIFFKTATASTR
jgi:tetratricopeptide (TPR) repeat protein